MQVCFNHSLKTPGRNILDGRDKLPPCIIDEAINASYFVQGELHEVLYVFFTADIALTGIDFPPTVLGESVEFCCCAFQAFEVAGGDDDLSAEGDEFFSYCIANTGATAGDDDALVLEEGGFERGED